VPIDLSSEYLPDQLPAGSDLVHLALPIFLQEPADAFVVKGRPAELDCRVAHALSVHFQCNDEVQSKTSTQDHVEPETGIRYTQARVQITRNQVEHFFGEYHCACVAVSGQGHSKSRLALVRVASLKKEFEVPPYADQSVEGKQVWRLCAHFEL
jgi:leucine-rich repeat transmembrane protein FLRT